jgi:ABC-2 type transport system permease protein
VIGWVVLTVLAVWLGGTGILGFGWRVNRAGTTRVLKLAVPGAFWFSVAVGLCVWMLTLSQWGAIGGFMAGVGVFALALGWDEFYDRVATGFYACVRREVTALFTTPIPYFVLFLFVLLSGVFFWAYLRGLQQVTLRYAFENVAQFGIFLFPLLTMGAFAREKAEGTVEVLMTAPISDVSVVVSKFLGILVFYVVMLLPTIVYFGLLRWIGAEIGKPEVGPIWTAYLGMVLLGAFFISMGMLASSFTSSQILAALLSWVFVIFFLIAGGLAEILGLVGTDLGDTLEFMSPLGEHLESFLTGVVDPKHLVYFLSFIVLFLFLTVRSVESRKWRS